MLHQSKVKFRRELKLSKISFFNECEAAFDISATDAFHLYFSYVSYQNFDKTYITFRCRVYCTIMYRTVSHCIESYRFVPFCII